MSERTSAAFLGLALAVVACGGSAPQRHVKSSVRLGPTDAQARRALLARVSPTAEAIVNTYETLPTTFELPKGPYNMPRTSTFDSYYRDSKIESVVTYMTTGVHEMTHGYATRMAFQILAERQLDWGDGAAAFPVGDGEPMLVRFTPTFPAREIESTFPGDVRTFRYGAYINPATPNLSTQVEGLYGLVDEYVAGYTGSVTTVDFWPWVRDEAPVDASVIINYAVAVDDVLGEYAEIRLFILHYLLHARDHHPDIYRGLVENEGLRRAFAAVDDDFTALVATVRDLEPQIWKLARTRGVTIDKRGGVLRIDGHPQRRDDGLRRIAVFAYLERDDYRAMSAALRAPAGVTESESK